MRLEYDTLGEVNIDDHCLWGAQTQRALHNFAIGEQRNPRGQIKALVIVKKAAAICNFKFDKISAEARDQICAACDQVLAGEHYDQFPLSVYHSGSGTQLNMNVNEVIANLANRIAGQPLGSKSPIHPNDHVNASQSSNDVFPTAMHISLLLALNESLLPALKQLVETIDRQSRRLQDVTKIGRTHMMDATPLTLGDEISGYAAQLLFSYTEIEKSLETLRSLAIGGTAVGTGLNAPQGWAQEMCEQISELTGQQFYPELNHFKALSSETATLTVSAACRGLASALMVIANNVRLLASGPRCGIAELKLPANEPGSSIMPGKVNPTQCEAVSMVAAQVMGLDGAVSIAASQGHLQLNVFRPLIISNTHQQIRLLTDACKSFDEHCFADIEPNVEQITQHLSRSLMLVTALAPSLGYDTAAKIAQQAHQEGKTLKQVVLEKNLMNEETFDEVCDPVSMR